MQKLSTLAKKSKTNQNKLEMKQRSIFQTKKQLPFVIIAKKKLLRLKRNDSFQALSTSAMRIEKSNQNYSKLSIIF